MAVSKRTVSRAIDELETAGWISVDRTGGDNTRNAQINLLIPGAGETRSDDNMLSPEQDPTGFTSGDNILSPENPSLQVTNNAPSGDRKGVVQVTDRLAAQKNLRTCEPEIAAEGGGYHTSRADRASASNSIDDASPNQCAVPALVETVAAQQQPSPSRINPIGTPADGTRAAFAEVSYPWPTDRTDDGAYAAYVAALAAAQGDTEVVLDAIWERLEESGADPPWLSDALRRIEHDLQMRRARSSGRQ
jgi:hypothetical protein